MSNCGPWKVFCAERYNGTSGKCGPSRAIQDAHVRLRSVCSHTRPGNNQEPSSTKHNQQDEAFFFPLLFNAARIPVCCAFGLKSWSQKQFSNQQRMVGVASQLGILCALGALGALAGNEHNSSHFEKRRYTVGVLLRKNWSSLQRLAREISDPRSASYGQYLDQEDLAQRIGIQLSEAKATASSLQKALKASEKPHIVAHRDAVVMSTHDFFATYELGPALTQNLSKAFPESVHMLVTPPMPHSLCKGLGEAECKSKKPCKWHEKKRHGSAHNGSHNHSNHSNHSKHSKHSCEGDFAGWICWRGDSSSFAKWRRPEAQWHCFEPSKFKKVNSTSLRRELRRRKGVNSVKNMRRAMAQMGRETKSHFRVVPRSGGFALLTRMNFSDSDWQSLEITFVQDGLTQNRFLSRADFILHHDYHSASVNSLKNLRHVNDIFVCFNMEADTVLAPQGQPGCDCQRNDTAWDNRLGRDCEKVWSLSPGDEQSGSVLPRAVQSLDALYRDLEAPFACLLY